MWFTVTGSPWPGLPERYPNWRCVHMRWRRGWCGRNCGEDSRVGESRARVGELRGGRCLGEGACAWPPRKRGGDLREAIGRSSGELTTNVILLTDALNFLCALS